MAWPTDLTADTCGSSFSRAAGNSASAATPPTAKPARTKSASLILASVTDRISEAFRLFAHLHQRAVDARTLQEVGEGGIAGGKVEEVEGEGLHHQVTDD